jgi:hypothetical protein
VAEVVPTLETLAEVRSVESADVDGGTEYQVLAQEVDGQAPDLRPLIYQIAREHGWPLCELRREVRTLETVFAELTQGELEAQAIEGGDWA